MGTLFARLEMRANRAMGARLANCEATVGGESVEAIFDRAYLAVDEVSSSGPALTVLGALPAGTKEDVTLVVVTNPFGTGGNFVVRRIEPDGSGATVLRLRK